VNASFFCDLWPLFIPLPIQTTESDHPGLGIFLSEGFFVNWWVLDKQNQLVGDRFLRWAARDGAEGFVGHRGCKFFFGVIIFLLQIGRALLPLRPNAGFLRTQKDRTLER
jgi:hypothetical protein